MNEADRKRVIVVGAGPAGIAAAIQLKRCGMEPLVFERAEVGGLIKNANLVENYPGFPEGISGRDLARLLREQCERCGLSIVAGEVLELEYCGDGFVARTAVEELVSYFAIVASGTAPRKMNAGQVAREAEERILYETYPIHKVTARDIAIVGGGDAAFDYALGLAAGNRVTIIYRGVEPGCVQVLWQRARHAENIRFLDGATVSEVVCEGDGLRLTFRRMDRESSMVVDHLVCAVGRDPLLGFLGPRLKGELARLARTNRMFLVGDVKNGNQRHVGICVGDGLRAAMDISNWKPGGRA